MAEIGATVVEQDPKGKPGQLHIRDNLWPSTEFINVGIRGDIPEITDVAVRENGDFAPDELVQAKFVDVIADVMHRRIDVYKRQDLIAPALGTAHGLYKAAPVLLVDRVKHLAALSDVAIVLHGGTGLSPEEFTAFIDAGVSKINISTALKLAYMHSARDHLTDAERTGKWEPVKLFDQVGASVREIVAQHIALFGSAQRIGVPA